MIHASMSRIVLRSIASAAREMPQEDLEMQLRSLLQNSFLGVNRVLGHPQGHIEGS